MSSGRNDECCDCNLHYERMSYNLLTDVGLTSVGISILNDECLIVLKLLLGQISDKMKRRFQLHNLHFWTNVVECLDK